MGRWNEPLVVATLGFRFPDLASVMRPVDGMNYPRTSQRYALAALIVLVFITLGLSVPIFVGGRPKSIVLQNAAVHAATRDTFVVATPIQLSSSPDITLQKGTLSIIGERGRPPATGEATAAILASGNARILLEDATIVLGIQTTDPNAPADASSTPSINPETLSVPMLAALTRLGFANLTIRRGVVVLKRSTGGTDVMSDVRLSLTARRGASLTATGSFELQGRQMELDATLGLASERKDVVQLPFKATVKGALLEAAVTGGHLLVGKSLRLSAEQAEVKVAGLRQTAGWLGAPWPGERGLNAFQAKGQLDWQDRSISFNSATFQMDGNEASGTLALHWGGPRPAIEGTLALKACDLSRYVKPDKPGSFMERSVLAWLGAASGPGSLALPLIRHLDADLRISADQVKAGSLPLGRSAASISIKDSKLLADIAEVEIASEGGSIRGQITVDMGGLVPRYIVRGKLEAIDTSKATGLVFGQSIMTGRGNILFDMAGFGESIEEIAATLHGKAGIELPEGGTLALDIPQLTAAASRTIELKGWGSAGRGETRISSLTSKFGIQSGLLFAEIFKAATSDKLLTLNGEVDIKARQVDAQMSIVRLVKDASGKDTIANDPTEVFNVRGSWIEPLIRYSTRPARAATPVPQPPPLAGQPG